ncbi:PadR family transcriptional regulator [Microlunatus sp. GCM10028923]|uniref:PadR family transcriptional regulator n=1 Tax=Microlunatus sp. GCM10028923 TaxID=3273400 RepID=UPI003614E391
MKFFILGLLIAQPQTLYDLHRRFDAGISQIYAASFGSIHRALRQLADAGEVAVVEASGSARGKKLYRVTPQGRRTWRHWMRTPGPAEDTELAALARVFLLGLLDEEDQRREVLRVLHQRAVADHRSLLEVQTALEADHETGRFPRRVLDYGLGAGQGLVDWLAELVAEASGTRR